MTNMHGWTHLPKSQGGTDPIPGLAGGGGAYCTLRKNTNYTISAGASPAVTWDEFDTNDTACFGTGTTTTIANTTGDTYLHLRKEGLYIACASCLRTSATGDFEHWIGLLGDAAALTGVNPSFPGYHPAAPGAFQRLQIEQTYLIVVPAYSTDDNSGTGPYIGIEIGNEDGSSHDIDSVNLSVLYIPSANTVDLFGTDEIYA